MQINTIENVELELDFRVYLFLPISANTILQLNITEYMNTKQTGNGGTPEYNSIQ